MRGLGEDNSYLFPSSRALLHATRFQCAEESQVTVNICSASLKIIAL